MELCPLSTSHVSAIYELLNSLVTKGIMVGRLQFQKTS